MPNLIKLFPVTLAGAGMLLAGCHQAPTPAATPVAAPTAQAKGAAKAAGDSGKAGGPATAPKPYDKVITKEAVTRTGLFITHRVGDKLYFEIPSTALNTDMLLVGRYASAPVVDPDKPFGPYGGSEFGERTIRWERTGNKVILRSPSFAIMADTSLPIYQAVRAGNYAPIIAVFDVATYGPDSAAVIDVTRLFTTNVPEYAAIQGQIDEKRSYIESAVAFPDNVEVEATQTGTEAPTPGASQGGSSRGPKDAHSVLAHWSMVRLPANPMMPRLADDRVGFFGLTRTDFGADPNESVATRYIARWRLDKKDPNAVVSDPVKPLVYYIDPATPDEWKPWIRKAILDWQPAFEQAGFTNAIIPMDAPANDPDWSPDDVRHTVIRWLPSTVENAMGPHISDPRTGEILNGTIYVYNDVLKLARDWYFVQVSPLDARAQKLPMPDSLMGRLIEYVTAHEIGHTLGLYHDHKGSSTYPADSVRSKTWVAKMGYSPSIMDYSRFNYVAQPEDHMTPEELIPHVGPYDTYAIRWGYTPIPGAHTPQAERPALDSIARMQDSVPWYRFGHLAESTPDNPDPGDQTESVGDADPVQSTGYGVKNIKRVMPLLLPATQHPGKDNSLLEELYGVLINQWTTEMGHVAQIVGGADVQLKYGSQPGPVFTPLSRARQVAAVKFLNQNAFQTPTYLLDDAVTSRLEASGSLDRIGNAQKRILGALLDNWRTTRLVSYAAADPKDSYTAGDLLGDLQHGIWSELDASRVAIDAYRRNLQDEYLDQLDAKLNPPEKPAARNSMPRRFIPPDLAPDVRAAMRGSLTDLRSQITDAVSHAANRETRLHLLDAKHRIDHILDPNK